jgi:hypothetical protein
MEQTARARNACGRVVCARRRRHLSGSRPQLGIDFLSDLKQSADVWAPIEKLCWVLDPKNLYDRVFPEVRSDRPSW